MLVPSVVAALALSASPQVLQFPAPVAPATAPAAESGVVRVLSYNVKGLPMGLSPFVPVETAHLIGRALNDFEVVLLQEDFAYHELVVEEAEHPFRSEPKTPSFGLVNDGLNRLSRLPLGPLTRRAWTARHGMFRDGAGDEMAEKGFSVSTLELAPGVEVHLYNLHGEAGHQEGDNAARAVGYEQLLAFVTEHSAGHPVIVGGDTNLKERRALDAGILLSLREELGWVEVGHALELQRDAVDRFFFRSTPTLEIRPLRLEHPAGFVDEDGRPLSDHRPLLAEFAWRRIERPAADPLRSLSD